MSLSFEHIEKNMSLAKGEFSGLIIIYLQVCGAVIFPLGVISWVERCKILGAAKSLNGS